MSHITLNKPTIEESIFALSLFVISYTLWPLSYLTSTLVTYWTQLHHIYWEDIPISSLVHALWSYNHIYEIVSISLFLNILTNFCRYQIINPAGIVGIADIKKQSQAILEATPLDPDMYRIGHTKAWYFFRLFI